MDSSTPTQLTAATTWQSIKAGDYNTFAIKIDGTLWGTGGNNYGSLGVGSTSQVISTMTQIGTASDWKQIAPGDAHTIGLKTNGSIWGWGQNDGYQMGDGSCCNNRLVPGQIGTDTDWKMVGTSSTYSAFAIKNNGTLWGWGFNIAGLLGDNLLSANPYPTQHNPY